MLFLIVFIDSKWYSTVERDGGYLRSNKINTVPSAESRASYCLGGWVYMMCADVHCCMSVLLIIDCMRY